MRIWSKIFSCLLAWIFGSLSVPAASRYTETFDGGLNGWVKFSGSFSLSHSASGGNSGGCLALGVLAGPPQPNLLGTVGDTVATNFVGNYTAGNLLLIGFDAWSASINTNANALTIGLEGTNSLSVYRDFSAPFPASNTWYSYRLSLNKSDLGAWYLNTESVDQIRESVTRVVLRPNFVVSNTLRFDNLFIDALPDAAGALTGTGGTSSITWNNLRTNQTYRVEAGTGLDASAWSVIDTFTATSSVIVASYPATNDYRFFRLVIP